MTTRSLFAGVICIIVSLCFSDVPLAQTTTGGTSPTSPDSLSPSTGSVLPDVTQGQPDFPDYIVTPREDLNPYGLSTLEKSTETDYVDGVGTLGTNQNRPSNIEVNRTRERNASEEDVNRNEENLSGAASEAIAETQSSASVSSSFRSAKKGRIYSWTDDQGILHVTNDLGSVPTEYQGEFIQESSGNQ